jgi:erythromycin esterase-like protein
VDLLGIGEQIHGSLGMSLAKSNLVASLVTHHGYRQVSFELAWGEMEALEAALNECARGAEILPPSMVPSADAVVHGWDPAMQQLLVWMCSYNRAHPGDPVHVSGFDGQQPWHDMRVLEPALARAQPPGVVSTIIEDLEQCHGARFETREEFREYGVAHGFPTPAAEEHSDCLAGLASASEALADTSMEPGVQRALDGLVAFEMASQELLVHRREIAAYEIREAFMVEVIRTQVSSQPGRTILWAHNTHVSKKSLSIRGTPARPKSLQTGQGYDSFGSILHRDPALRYESIGVVGLEVHTSMGSAYDPEIPVQAQAVEIMTQANVSAERIDWQVDLEHWAPAGTRLLLGGEWMVPRDQFRWLVVLGESPAR